MYTQDDVAGFVILFWLAMLIIEFLIVIYVKRRWPNKIIVSLILSAAIGPVAQAYFAKWIFQFFLSLLLSLYLIGKFRTSPVVTMSLVSLLVTVLRHSFCGVQFTNAKNGHRGPTRRNSNDSTTIQESIVSDDANAPSGQAMHCAGWLDVYKGSTKSRLAKCCPKCGKEVSIEEVYCQHCGFNAPDSFVLPKTWLPVYKDNLIVKERKMCPDCEATMPNDLRSCSNCGYAPIKK